MVITTQTIITTAGVLSALGVIFGVIVSVVKWFNKQEKQSTDIKQLEETHKQDMKDLAEHHKQDSKYQGVYGNCTL